MKRLFYIFAAVLAVVSCSQKEELAPEKSGNQIVDGMLKCEFTVKDPSFKPATKTLGDTLAVKAMTMKVVVFDQHGVYLSQSDAELERTGVGTGTYSAYFPVSDRDEKRIVHFLGNYNETIEYGTELEVISQLTTTNKVDGYWQRVEVDNLKAQEVDGNMELIKKAQLNNIVLIRNFCKLTITAMAGSNLEISQAYVYNVPDAGSIAPYSSNKSGFVGSTKGGFITDYSNYETTQELIAAGYNSCVPINSNLIVHHNDDVLTNAEETKIYLFSYEREMPLNDPPFIIVGGYFGETPQAISDAKTANKETFYKINLRDQEENYFPLLRNFDYKIAISEVRGEGSTSIDEALASPGSGDVSTDVRFNSLTEISNGEAKMMVTETEVMLVSQDSYQIKFKFIPNISQDVSDNGSVDINLGPEGTAGAVFDKESSWITIGGDDSQGWRTLKFNPNEPGANPRKQAVIITGSYTDPNDAGKQLTISRTISFLLREKPELSAAILDGSNRPISCIEEVKETPFKLQIKMPGGLPSSIFPLDLEIEASANSITPIDHLPVSSSKSRFDSTKPTIVYTKTVNYSEYVTATSNGEATFYVNFKTNKSVSTTDIMVSHSKFEPATTYFHTPYYFDNLRIDQASSSTSLLKFDLHSADPVTIDLHGFAEPSGSTVSMMRQIGASTSYIYTPSAAGEQSIELTLDENNGCRFDISAEGYKSQKIGRVSRFGFSFVGSDRTNDSSALIPGFETTLKIPVSGTGASFISGSGTVVFTINGENRDAAKNGDFYEVSYTVPSDYTPGPITVSYSATEDGVTYSTSLSSISVWKQRITVGNTAITDAAELSDNNVNWDYVDGGSKKIWKGVVLSNLGSNTRYLTATNTTFDYNQPNSNFSVNHCFQSNGTYLKTYNERYLTTANLSATESPTNVTITYYNNGWVFTNDAIENNTNRTTLQLNSTRNLFTTTYNLRWNSVQGKNINDTYRWTAYPATVDYVEP